MYTFCLFNCFFCQLFFRWFSFVMYVPFLIGVCCHLFLLLNFFFLKRWWKNNKIIIGWSYCTHLNCFDSSVRRRKKHGKSHWHWLDLSSMQHTYTTNVSCKRIKKMTRRKKMVATMYTTMECVTSIVMIVIVLLDRLKKIYIVYFAVSLWLFILHIASTFYFYHFKRFIKSPSVRLKNQQIFLLINEGGAAKTRNKN